MAILTILLHRNLGSGSGNKVRKSFYVNPMAIGAGKMKKDMLEGMVHGAEIRSGIKLAGWTEEKVTHD